MDRRCLPSSRFAVIPSLSGEHLPGETIPKRSVSRTVLLREAALVALLFLVAVVNYFDRQSLSVVAPRFQAELHLSDQGYGHIVSLFLFASAIAYALAGLVADWLGTRRSMALFVGWWSVAEAMTAFATSAIFLGATRFCLGLGEPGLWVAAPKAVGEFLEERKRALAVGIYSMGATIGAVVSLPLIAFVTTHLPWRSIFLLDGAVGLLWIPVWFWFLRRMPGATARPQISAPCTSEPGWRTVLRNPTTWKLVAARGLTDPVWYFLLFWFPKYLMSARHLTLSAIAHTGWLVYLGGGIGALSGGALSAFLMRRGMSIGLAYRSTMLLAAILIPLCPLTTILSSGTGAILIASLIAFAHMNWLVTLTAIVVELYPPRQVGKAAGFIASGSGFGGMLSSELIGYVVTHHGYTPLFYLMALLHPMVLVLLWRVFLQTRVAEPYIALDCQ